MTASSTAASHSGSQTILAADFLLGVPLFLGCLGTEELTRFLKLIGYPINPEPRPFCEALPAGAEAA
jgi:hypothetical protein